MNSKHSEGSTVAVVVILVIALLLGLVLLVGAAGFFWYRLSYQRALQAKEMAEQAMQEAERGKVRAACRPLPQASVASAGVCFLESTCARRTMASDEPHGECHVCPTIEPSGASDSPVSRRLEGQPQTGQTGTMVWDTRRGRPSGTDILCLQYPERRNCYE